MIDTFLVTDASGVLRQRHHPGWMLGDTPEVARKLTSDELVDHGFGLLVVTPEITYDPTTHEVIWGDPSEWTLTDREAIKTYTLVERPPEPLPSLSARQIRLGLLSIGITEAQVDAALVNDAAGLIEWKFASYFIRDHALVVSLATAFSLPTEQVDTLWRWAADI